MNFTLGFFVIFLSLIIPGLIFRRFYFFGEFSKQFNTKDPVLHSIYFSIIPGILIQVFCLVILNFLFKYDVSFTKIFHVMRDFTQDVEEVSGDTTNFLKNDIGYFFLYSIILVVISGFIGYILSRIIRTLNWDRKIKLFRFKNQWYYVFSGEILSMKKFKDAIRVTFNKDDDYENEILTTYADILINIKDNVRELYTGFVVDYDLNTEDITKLDRIYLINTCRYKITNHSNHYKKNDIGFNKVELINNQIEDVPTRNQKNIPGNVFILDASNIMNINLTYVPNTLKIEENKLIKEKKHTKRQNLYKRASNFLVFILLSILIFNYTNLFSLIKSDIYDFYLNEFGFFRKTLMLFFIIQLLSILSPNKNDDGIFEYNLELKKSEFLVLIFLLFFNLFNIIDFYFFLN
jgi:hypothetical protein